VTDARAVLRVTDELLWVLRRAGFSIATSQAIDAVRAARAVGLGSRELLRDAMATVVVERASDRGRFDATFDAFFAREPRRTLWERIAAAGFTPAEIDALRELLEAYAASSPDDVLGPLLHRGAELDRLLQLSGASGALAAMQSPLQAGFHTHRLLEEVGTWRARDDLSALEIRLRDAIGAERATALTALLARELSRAADEVREVARDRLEEHVGRAAPSGRLDTPFTALDAAELEAVRRAVRSFVQRLRGGERVRRRRRQHGRVDAAATLRRAMRTGGVPFTLLRRARRRDKPSLLLLCDVSDSVRDVARFLLELTYSAQELFERTRSFVFVSELGETTHLFAEQPVEVALARAYSGTVVPVSHNSSYGRVLRSFAERVLPDVDRRTTVVILGDGRNNYQADSAEVLDAVRARARALIWLCPEPRAQWATGDSAMARYAPRCTRVLEVRSARDLEHAARLLLALR